jgi:putative ABC transport system permease protein
VRPQIGPGFPDDKALFVPNEPVAVIRDRLWRTRVNADPSIVGRQLTLSDGPTLSAGVMPPKFHYPDDIDLWQRLQWDYRQHYRSAHFLEAIARLSDDSTLERAGSAVDALSLRLQAEFASTNKGWSVRLVPLLHEALGYYRHALIVLFGAVELLLVIACFNVASLRLVRALSPEREIAVRVALGAAPSQLAVQLVSESFVRSTMGAVLGIATAAIALPLIVSFTRSRFRGWRRRGSTSAPLAPDSAW